MWSKIVTNLKTEFMGGTSVHVYIRIVMLKKYSGNVPTLLIMGGGEGECEFLIKIH